VQERAAEARQAKLEHIRDEVSSGAAVDVRLTATSRLI
jgi:hypothetical protein